MFDELYNVLIGNWWGAVVRLGIVVFLGVCGYVVVFAAGALSR